MRVVHVLGRLRPSGAERMLECAGGSWAAHGVACTVVGMSDQPHDFAPALAAAGYGVALLPDARSVRGLVTLARELLRLRPDVVHVHAERNFLSVVLVARMTGARAVVRTVHSHFPYEGRVRRRRRRRARISRLLGVSWVACGREVAEHERRHLGTDPAVVLNWADVPRLAAAAAGDRGATRARVSVPEQATVVSVVGSCDRVKNHALLLEAAAGTGVTVLHAGCHDAMPDDERHGVQALPAQQVRLLGPRADIADLLAASDAVAIPSHREGMPVVALEAMCVGVPVLASDTVGLRELGDADGVTLLPFSGERWAAALRRLAEHPRQAAATREHHRRQACERFSPRRGVAEYAALYHALLGSRRR